MIRWIKHGHYIECDTHKISAAKNADGWQYSLWVKRSHIVNGIRRQCCDFVKMGTVGELKAIVENEYSKS